MLTSARNLSVLKQFTYMLPKGAVMLIALIANSFIYSNFNCCPLVLHFCSQRLMNKIENIQKRILGFVLNDSTSNHETLLNKSSRCTMEVRRLRLLALEILNQVATLLHHDFNQIKQIRNLGLDPFLKTVLCFFFCFFFLLCIVCTLAFICDYFCIFVYF